MLDGGRRGFLRGVAALPLIGGGAALAEKASGHDPLIALGERFEAAWRDQVATFDRLRNDMSDAAVHACDAAYEKTEKIVAQIEAAKATSLGGVVIKARACSWCHSGDLFTGTAFDDQHTTTDYRIAATIIRDLISLSGLPLPEIQTLS